ncbi:MAG TPA: hypothetical protein VL947_04690, partial [Cytophagales bacterium]|nr:hypothetical protein [Cytophagales bacterium]
QSAKGIKLLLGISSKNNLVILNAVEFNKYNIIVCSKLNEIIKSIPIDLSEYELNHELFENSNTMLDAMERLFFYSPEEKTVRFVLPLKDKTYKSLSYPIEE